MATMTRSRRRTKVEVVRDRETDWLANAHDGFAQYGLCLSCGEMCHVRGKSRGTVKCRGCYIGGRPLTLNILHGERTEGDEDET